MVYKRIFAFLAALVLISVSVSAFAVSSQYYGDNPLYLQPGQSQEIKMMLQNNAGTEDINVKLTEIKEGKDIIEMKDSKDVFLVPKGGKTDVYFKVTAPSDAKKGDIFPVTLMFASIAAGNNPIGLSGSIGKGFNVVIGQASDFAESPKGGNNRTAIYLILGIALLIAAIYFLLKRKDFSKKAKATKKF